MNIAGIDPGTDESAIVVWDGEKIVVAATGPNDVTCEVLRRLHPDIIVGIEKVVSYGQALGQSTIDTAVWIGRFMESASHVDGVYLIPRREIRMAICDDGSPRVKDANIRQALIDRFGEPPTKKKPNPVYGTNKLKGHEWQAFAVAVTLADRRGKHG